MVPVVLPPEPGMVDWFVDGVVEGVVDWVVEGMVEGEVDPEPMPEALGVIGVVEGVVVDGLLPLPLGGVVWARATPLARTSARPQAVEVAIRKIEWDMLAPDVNECSTSVARTEDSVCG